MLWECHELDAAEVYPDGLPPDVLSSFIRFNNLTTDRYILLDFVAIANNILVSEIHD